MVAFFLRCLDVTKLELSCYRILCGLALASTWPMHQKTVRQYCFCCLFFILSRNSHIVIIYKFPLLTRGGMVKTGTGTCKWLKFGLRLMGNSGLTSPLLLSSSRCWDHSKRDFWFLSILLNFLHLHLTTPWSPSYPLMPNLVRRLCANCLPILETLHHITSREKLCLYLNLKGYSCFFHLEVFGFRWSFIFISI